VTLEGDPAATVTNPVIDTAWATRAFAALCVAAGVYAASVSLFRITHGEPAGTWLLPLATGALTAILGIAVACERAAGAVALGEVARRAGAVVLLGIYAFVLLPLLGFLPASLALVIAVSACYATKRPAVVIGGLVIVAGLWAFFAFVLTEPLPRGLWWR
jgi:hypothetical protein